MKDSVTIATIDAPHLGAHKVIVVSVFYSKGGMNYFTGKQDARGYSVAARIEEHRDGLRSFLVSGNDGGGRALLGVATRFNAKTLTGYADAVQARMDRATPLLLASEWREAVLLLATGQDDDERAAARVARNPAALADAIAETAALGNDVAE